MVARSAAPSGGSNGITSFPAACAAVTSSPSRVTDDTAYASSRSSAREVVRAAKPATRITVVPERNRIAGSTSKETSYDRTSRPAVRSLDGRRDDATEGARAGGGLEARALGGGFDVLLERTPVDLESRESGRPRDTRFPRTRAASASAPASRGTVRHVRDL